MALLLQKVTLFWLLQSKFFCQALLRGAEKIHAEPLPTGGAFAFSYAQHGLDWASGLCASRHEQSPIDLPAEGYGQATGNFTFTYIDDPLSYELIRKPGGVLALDFATSGYAGGVLYEGLWYDLLNINVHARSEHTWNQVDRPAEIHLVHKHRDGTELLVVAVAFDCTGGCVQALAPAPMPAPAGLAERIAPAPAAMHLLVPSPAAVPAPAPAVSASQLSFQKGYRWHARTSSVTALNESSPVLQAFMNPKATVPLRLNDLFQGASFLDYYGSTTAPPCAESVVWLVRTEASTMSVTQAQYLLSEVLSITGGSGNNRATMPLNGRTLALREAIHAPWSLNSSAPGFEVPVELPTNRELQAWAGAAPIEASANAVRAKVQDVLVRERRGAQAEDEFWRMN